ncbi:MAG TPA: hypothetical protein VKB49_03510 [Candidatus Sulfotelmatobacter sp.]|nr:hypothetical protein [Candidatus Sulfotelmatobacter sp.]
MPVGNEHLPAGLHAHRLGAGCCTQAANENPDTGSDHLFAEHIDIDPYSARGVVGLPRRFDDALGRWQKLHGVPVLESNREGSFDSAQDDNTW